MQKGRWRELGEKGEGEWNGGEGQGGEWGGRVCEGENKM